MKKIISFIMALMITMSLTAPAFAANATDYLSNPEARSEYENQMAERDRLIAEKDALKAQFNKDNPGVSEYILNGVSFSSELFYDNFYNSLGIERWYTGYHGSGYYKLGGTVTVYANYQTYTAYQLLPDPKPQVTKTYLAKVAEINKKIKNAEDAADNASMQSLNEDIAMVQKITSRFYPDTEYNNSILLIFQIGNYMFAGGNTNYVMMGADHIIPNSREGAPYITNGHTMVPIRSVIEGLGGTVDWDPELNGARCSLNGTTITMPIGSEYAYVNDSSIKMTTPAIVKNGRTMIPVRFVAETLGYRVEYISDGAFVVIRKPEVFNGYTYQYGNYYKFSYKEGTEEWLEYDDTTCYISAHKQPYFKHDQYVNMTDKTDYYKRIAKKYNYGWNDDVEIQECMSVWTEESEKYEEGYTVEIHLNGYDYYLMFRFFRNPNYTTMDLSQSVENYLTEIEKTIAIIGATIQPEYK